MAVETVVATTTGSVSPLFRAQVAGWRESRQGSLGAPMLDDVPLYVSGELTARSTPHADVFMIAGHDVVRRTIHAAIRTEFPNWADPVLLTESVDGPWAARLRRHQSWYREVVLGLPPGDLGDRPVASLLPTWAVAQDPTINFLVSDEIHGAVVERLALRGGGGIVEPNRLFHNLLSSQPLCFNLFGMLRFYPEELALGLSKLLDHGIAEIIAVKIEHAPRFPGYRSGSAFDCYIEYRTSQGELGFLGVETKYAEQLSRQRLSQNPSYEEAIRARPAIFRPEAVDALRRPATCQLLYNCILAIMHREQADHGFEEQLGRCVVLTSGADDEARSAVDAVRACVQQPDDLLLGFSYDQLVDAMPFSEDLEAWKDQFRLRYLDLRRSS